MTRLTLAIATLLLFGCAHAPVQRECDRTCAMSLTMPDVGTRQ